MALTLLCMPNKGKISLRGFPPLGGDLCLGFFRESAGNYQLLEDGSRFHQLHTASLTSAIFRTLLFKLVLLGRFSVFAGSTQFPNSPRVFCKARVEPYRDCTQTMQMTSMIWPMPKWQAVWFSKDSSKLSGTCNQGLALRMIQPVGLLLNV